MNLLSRYLAKEIYLSVLIVFGALLMLFELMDLIAQLSDMGTGSYHIGYILLFVLLTMPGHIYELFPVAVLIGTIFALVQMAANSELTVYRASGVSLKQMINTLMRIGVPFLLACFLVGEFVAPPSQHLAQQIKLKAKNAQISLGDFRSGVWVKDEGSFINVKSVLPDTTLLGMTIYQFDEQYHLRNITAAERAVYTDGEVWALYGVKQTQFGAQGATVNQASTMQWRSALKPNIFTVLLVDPEQMSAWGLYQYIRHLNDNKQKTARYEIAMWNKLVYPVAILVMMLLALPFSSYHRREGGIGGKIFLGVVLGLGFHFGGRLFANLGALKEWSPVISSTAMMWLFLALALTMLWRTERR